MHSGTLYYFSFFSFLYISYLNLTVYFVYQFRIYCKIIGSHYEHLIQLIPYNSLVTSLFVIMKMFFLKHIPGENFHFIILQAF